MPAVFYSGFGLIPFSNLRSIASAAGFARSADGFTAVHGVQRSSRPAINFCFFPLNSRSAITRSKAASEAGAKKRRSLVCNSGQFIFFLALRGFPPLSIARSLASGFLSSSEQRPAAAFRFEGSLLLPSFLPNGAREKERERDVHQCTRAREEASERRP